MAGGYGAPVSLDEYQRLFRLVQGILDRIKTLERPTGTQNANIVRELQRVVAGLTEQTEVNVAGNVTAGGTVIATGGLRSPDVYSRVVTGTGSWHATYSDSNGQLGYVPSSRRFKQDITPAPDLRDVALAISVVTFRYRNAVETLGDSAGFEWGVIAEDLHNLGLHWLLDYDEDGNPLGVRKEQLIFAFIPVIQDHEARLRAAGL